MNQPVAVVCGPGAIVQGPGGCSAVHSLRHHPETSMKTGESRMEGSRAGIERRSVEADAGIWEFGSRMLRV
jgi:hypothetical protein